MPAGADAPRDGWLAALARRLEAEQERWFLWLPVMLGIGIGIYFSLDSEPHLLTALSVGAVGIAARLFAPKRTLGLLLGSALMAIGLGFALAKVRVETVRAPVLVKQMRGEVRGFVELIEPRSPRGDRITLRVISLGAMPEEQRPTRVRITSTTSTPGLAAGDAVVVNATLMPPAGPALPGEYDFGRQAWFEQLGAVGYTRSAIHFDPDVGPAPSDLAFWNAIERFRHLVSARVRAVLPGESGAIADALITGERGGISPRDEHGLSQLGAVPHPVDLGPAHGDRGGLGVLRRAVATRRGAVARAALSYKEVGGRRRHAGRASAICSYRDRPSRPCARQS